MQKKELYEALNRGMLEERYKAFKRNLMKNKPSIVRYGGLSSIVPKLQGKHVCIAGAGVSLELAYGLLQKIQYRETFVLIATDMAFRPLMVHGICPHYVISCETTPTDFFAELETGESHLLLFSCAAHRNLRLWKGPISFYNWMIQEQPYAELWEYAGIELGFVATGSIVTTQAVSLALGCGIQSLMLVGNDLAFDNQYYVKGSVSDIRRAQQVQRLVPRTTLEYETIRNVRHYYIHRQGEHYSTHNQFLAAKYWLEELFARQRLPIYDMSVPGCSEHHVRRISPGQYATFFNVKRKRRKR